MPQDVSSTPHFAKIRFQLRAPLTHGAFGLGGGNAMPLRRFPVLTPEGVVDVPAVSGNSLRGQLRRIVMREILAPADEQAVQLLAALATASSRRREDGIAFWRDF